MSKRSLLGFLVVLASIGLAAGDAAAFSATYDQKVTQGRDVFQSKVSLKDELFKMEMTMQGQTSIILHNAEGTYTVMPSEGMAMKTALHPGQGPVKGADNYAQYLQQQHAERTGSETIDGKACDIYHYVDSETRDDTTAWVWKDKMFPIKIETNSPNGIKTLVEVSNIQLGAALPDDTFQLPTGVQVMDMGAMMGMR